MIIYTFRNYPHLDKLKEISSDVFVFSELKRDFVSFTKLIVNGNANVIIGIANTKYHSRLEPVAINRFNNGKLRRNGADELELFVPNELKSDFVLAKIPSNSFCNWTMYNIQSFINDNNLSCKLTFIHHNKKDINKLIPILSSLCES